MIRVLSAFSKFKDRIATECAAQLQHLDCLIDSKQSFLEGVKVLQDQLELFLASLAGERVTQRPLSDSTIQKILSHVSLQTQNSLVRICKAAVDAIDLWFLREIILQNYFSQYTTPELNSFIEMISHSFTAILSSMLSRSKLASSELKCSF